MATCTACSVSFDVDNEGMEGEFGIIPVAFCATCSACVRDLAEQNWDLVPRDDVVIRPLLLTVPGSGTRFVMKFLADVLRVDVPQVHAGNFSFGVNYQEIIRGKTVVISTLRDPYLSWLSREPPAGLAAEELGAFNPLAINRHWPAFIKVLNRFRADGVKVTFIDIDETNVVAREVALIAVAMQLGAYYDPREIREFARAWEPVGARRNTEHKIEYRNYGTIDGRVPDFLDYAVKFLESVHDN